MLCIVSQYTLPDALGQNALLTCVLVSARVGVGVCPSVHYISLNTSFVFCFLTSIAENRRATQDIFCDVTVIHKWPYGCFLPFCYPSEHFVTFISFLGELRFHCVVIALRAENRFFQAFLGAAIMDALSSELTFEKYSENQKASIEKGDVNFCHVPH